MINDNTLNIKVKLIKYTRGWKYINLRNSWKYLGNMVDDLRASGKCSLHFTMKINFMSSKHNDQGQTVRSKSDNIENMISV